MRLIHWAGALSFAAAVSASAGCSAASTGSLSATSTGTTVRSELSGTAVGHGWRVELSDGGMFDDVPMRCLDIRWDQEEPGISRSCGGYVSDALVTLASLSPAPDGSSILHVGYVGPGVPDLVIVASGVDYPAAIDGALFAVVMPGDAVARHARFTKDGAPTECESQLPDALSAPRPPPADPDLIGLTSMLLCT